MHEQIGKDEERQQAKLNTLRRDLQTARRAADEATGLSTISCVWQIHLLSACHIFRGIPPGIAR